MQKDETAAKPATPQPATRDDEYRHCETAVGDLADREGLVVITPAVVDLLMRERAAARAQGRQEAADEWSSRWQGAVRLTAEAEDKRKQELARKAELPDVVLVRWQARIARETGRLRDLLTQLAATVNDPRYTRTSSD